MKVSKHRTLKKVLLNIMAILCVVVYTGSTIAAANSGETFVASRAASSVDGNASVATFCAERSASFSRSASVGVQPIARINTTSQSEKSVDANASRLTASGAKFVPAVVERQLAKSASLQPTNAALNVRFARSLSTAFSTDATDGVSGSCVESSF